MKVIYGPRYSGKTYELIRMAHETDQYIIVPFERDARHLFSMAKREGMPIRNPITVDECLRGRLRSTPYAMYHPHGGVLVDDTTRILETLLRIPKIQALSVCAKDSLGLETRLDAHALELMRDIGCEEDA